MSIETQAGAILLRWTPEPADLREMTHRPAFRRQMTKSIVIAVLLFAAGALMVAAGSSTGIMVATAGGVLLLLIVLGPRRTVQLRWRTDPLLRDPVEYVIDENGLSRRQQDFSCWWGWSRIRNMEESSGAFILRIGTGRASDGPFLILSKRGLAGPADEARLRELLDERVRRRSR